MTRIAIIDPQPAVRAGLSVLLRAEPGLVPIVGAIILFFSGRSDIDSITMLLMAASAQLFFVFLTNRLYSTSVEPI